MGRWLSKEEREKRDKKIIELYQQGYTWEAIAERFSMSTSQVGHTLKRHGVKVNRT